MRDELDLPKKLENKIQHYPWGSRSLIPELLGLANKQDEPFAELWMGVHPRGESEVVLTSSQRRKLSDIITSRPIKMLGPDSAVKFDSQLPFLFKVFAADQALSIQAHPNRVQAEAGFREEERKGIPVDAFHRNYRDSNHKPEIICALTPFTAMCGFRAPREIDQFYRQIGSPVYHEHIAPKSDFSDQSTWLHSFFHNLMQLDEKKKDSLLDAVYDWAKEKGSSEAEAELTCRLSEQHPGDIGTQAPLFLNIVSLQPGEALYQPAGVLHAYVEGMGVELMANSDNVLRGGLTSKHVDVQELLKVLDFKPREPDVLHGVSTRNGINWYEVPIDEFELHKMTVEDEKSVLRTKRSSIELGICTEGEIFIKKDPDDQEHLLHVVRGESFVIPHVFGSYACSGDGTVYVATIPESKERPEK